MHTEPFEVPIEGGALRGERGGAGERELLLHGGAAVPDYTCECAESLDGEDDPLPVRSSTETAAA